MKKLLLVLLMMILVASFALAQKKVRKVVYETVSNDPSSLMIGGKFGLNFATFGGDNSSFYSTTTKILFGGFVAYNFLENFGIQGELLYNSVGASYSANGQNGNIGISYLEIVPLAKFSVPVSPVVKIFFVAGPQLGIKLSANAHSDANSTDTDISTGISGSDFDIVFGTGTSFRIGAGSLNVDLRYNIGISNVNKTSPPSNSNQAFNLAVGYGFYL